MSRVLIHVLILFNCTLRWGTKCEVVVRMSMSMSSYSTREQKECGGGGGGVECNCHDVRADATVR